MSQQTLRTLQETYGIAVEPALGLDELIPVLTGLQFQGDVAIIPEPSAPAATTPIPASGVDVVRGERGGHAHTVIGDGCFDPARPGSGEDGLDLGLLTVPDGAVAYLAHAEHGYSGIGPGRYRLRRQRELRQAAAMPVWD